MALVTVPLKIIWIGEHAVCYDKRAIGQTLPRLQLRLVEGQRYEDSNDEAVIEFIENFWNLCRQKLDGFVRTALPDFAVEYDAPVGIGLGTSAALAVALAELVVRSLMGRVNGVAVREVIEASEKQMHYRASGIDQYLVCQPGGLHEFQNGEGVAMAGSFPFPFVVLDSGTGESTGELVGRIAELWQTNRSKVFNPIRQIGNLAYEFKRGLREVDFDQIYACIVQNQAELENLGVVTAPVAEFCQRLQAFRIAAKITGGGGTTAGSGAIIACYQKVEDYSRIRQLAEQFNFGLVYKAEKEDGGYV